MNVVHDMVLDIDLTTHDVGRLEPEPRGFVEMDDDEEVDEGFQEEEEDPTQPPVDIALLWPQPEDCPLRRPPPPTTPVRPTPPEEPTSPPRTPVRPLTSTAEESPLSVSFLFIYLLRFLLLCILCFFLMLMDMFLNIFFIFPPTSDRHGIPGTYIYPDHKKADRPDEGNRAVVHQHRQRDGPSPHERADC